MTKILVEHKFIKPLYALIKKDVHPSYDGIYVSIKNGKLFYLAISRYYVLVVGDENYRHECEGEQFFFEIGVKKIERITEIGNSEIEIETPLMEGSFIQWVRRSLNRGNEEELNTLKTIDYSILIKVKKTLDKLLLCKDYAFSCEKTTTEVKKFVLENIKNKRVLNGIAFYLMSLELRYLPEGVKTMGVEDFL